MPDGREVVAEAFRGRRDDLGWSQAELAARSGISVGTIQSIERPKEGKSWDNPRSLPAIEKALGWETGAAERIRNGLEPILRREDPEGPPLSSAQVPVGSGIDPELLVEIASATPDELQRVRGFLAGLKASRNQNA
ncbi:transcriptional regulator with XRE-family HTH domain [Catenulispora sp. GAS73]|uniref:helix-turn-helix domain-containing protein n=1 Tax=Catenulispora sp. GAS73 TaxID=3156269 RepID=UPI003513D824